jgi:hypothetical protein
VFSYYFYFNDNKDRSALPLAIARTLTAARQQFLIWLAASLLIGIINVVSVLALASGKAERSQLSFKYSFRPLRKVPPTAS